MDNLSSMKDPTELEREPLHKVPLYCSRNAQQDPLRSVSCILFGLQAPQGYVPGAIRRPLCLSSPSRIGLRSAEFLTL